MQLSVNLIPVQFTFLGGTAGGYAVSQSFCVWHGSIESSDAVPSISVQGLFHERSHVHLNLGFLCAAASVTAATLPVPGF